MNDESQTHNPQSGQTIIINQQTKESNGVGTAGFVLAICALIFGWVPVLGWIIWLLGLILSIVGITRNPKGLAIAGLVISLLGLILLVAVFGAILGGAALLG
jgi:ABC-type long-subunit fatty acid transport system fused permease/ATPase subunit